MEGTHLSIRAFSYLLYEVNKYQEGMKQQQNHCTVVTVNCFTDNKGKPTIFTSGLTEEHRVHCKLKEDLCLLVSSLLSSLWHHSLQGQ